MQAGAKGLASVPGLREVEGLRRPVPDRKPAGPTEDRVTFVDPVVVDAVFYVIGAKELPQSPLARASLVQRIRVLHGADMLARHMIEITRSLPSGQQTRFIEGLSEGKLRDLLES